MISSHIDQLRNEIWFQQLTKISGMGGPFALGARLDKKSIWIDAAGVAHQSKWYRFKSGKQVPSKELAQRVSCQVPELAFDIHHPVWRLLRNPNISARTLRRLVADMPGYWRLALEQLGNIELNQLAMGANLVKFLSLENMEYLDYVLLVECARRQACGALQAQRRKKLTAILLIGPILFLEDPIWDFNSLEKLEQRMAIFDEALHLEEFSSEVVQFPRDSRIKIMVFVRNKLICHKSIYPRSLGNTKLIRRYIVRNLYDAYDDVLRIVCTPYYSDGYGSIDLLSHRESPIDKRLWLWAQEKIDKGPGGEIFFSIKDVMKFVSAHDIE